MNISPETFGVRFTEGSADVTLTRPFLSVLFVLLAVSRLGVGGFKVQAVKAVRHSANCSLHSAKLVADALYAFMYEDSHHPAPVVLDEGLLLDMQGQSDFAKADAAVVIGRVALLSLEHPEAPDLLVRTVKQSRRPYVKRWQCMSQAWDELVVTRKLEKFTITVTAEDGATETVTVTGIGDTPQARMMDAYRKATFGDRQ